MPPRKRILVADDHSLILAALAGLLEPTYEVVGRVTDGRQLVIQATSLKPDAIVLDIGMPGLNGIEAARQITERDDKVKLVFLTQQLDTSFVHFAFNAGAHGYVAKQASSDELLIALKAVFRGEYYATSLLSGEGAEKLARWNPRSNPAGLFDDKLTPRQREVLQLIAEGKSAKEIGASLHITAKTAEFHRLAIMDQLGLRTTAELTRYALATGIATF